MTRLFTLAGFVFLLFSFVPALAAEAPVLRDDWGEALKFGPPIKEATAVVVLSDAKNCVWGIVRPDKERKQALARWTDEGWTPVLMTYTGEVLDYWRRYNSGSAAEATGTYYWMQSLYPGPDGTVVAMGGVSDAPSLQVRGDRARWMNPQDKRGLEWRLFEDGAGIPWVVWGEAQEFFIEGPRKYSAIMTINKELSGLGHLLTSIRMDDAIAFKLVQDAQGRYWYPHTEVPDAEGRFDINDIIILDPNFDPKKAALDTLGAGFPPTQIFDGTQTYLLESPVDRERMRNDTVSFTVPRDSGTFWLGMLSHPLRVIDTATLSAKEVPLAQGKHMQGMSRIVQYQGAWYGVADFGVLWQEKEGVWGPVLDPLDGGMGMEPDIGMERSFLATDQGLWMGAYQRGGAVFISKTGAFERFDGQRAFPLPEVDAIVRLPNNRLMFVLYGKMQHVADEGVLLQTALDPSSPKPKVVTLQEYPGRLVQDTQGYVWKPVSSAPPYEFHRWEAGAWRTFKLDALPTFPIFPLVYNVVCDTLNRLWIIKTGYEDVAVYVFTPPSVGSKEPGVCVEYGNYQEALVAGQVLKPEFLAQGLSWGSETRCPVYGPSGQMAYIESNHVCWYDGKAWHKWTKRGDLQETEPAAWEYVCFDAQGRLQYYRRKQHILESPEQWRSPESGQADASLCKCLHSRRSFQQIAAPAYVVAPDPDIVVRDREDTYWLQYGAKLYRAGFGICRPVYPEDAATPLFQSFYVSEVLIDPVGTTFIGLRSTESHGPYPSHFLAPAAQAPPVTRLTAGVEQADTVVLEATADPAGTYWFTWRMDGGPWHDATQDTTIRVEHTPSGSHTFEARAIGEHFELSLPASVAIAVTVNSDAIEQWIAALSSKDFDQRREAIQSLAANAREALPRLQTAREKADADTQWWIDSAIQRCEEMLQHGSVGQNNAGGKSP